MMKNRYFASEKQVHDGWCELFQMVNYHLPKGVRLMEEDQRPFFTVLTVYGVWVNSYEIGLLPGPKDLQLLTNHFFHT